MHIDIWSDVVCPWCYLGSRRLDSAIRRLGETHPEVRTTVRWRAFELDPNAPSEAQELRPVIERKYGPGAFDAMNRRLVALGATDGIDYRFDTAQRVNTFDAHRLIAWAGDLDDSDSTAESGSHDRPRAQDRLVEATFDAYFTRGADVSDPKVLRGLAAEAGLDPDAAAEVLAAGSYAEEVRAEESAARERQVTGVPAVVIDDRVLIPGAQEVDTFLRILQKVAASSGV